MKDEEHDYLLCIGAILFYSSLYILILHSIFSHFCVIYSIYILSRTPEKLLCFDYRLKTINGVITLWIV